ncbi:PREDICTED: uncharacterized protein LOC107881858 [Prunus mume]|uniref:Uncharacterized protein LOC107881858 n=1 Tax=Prunus mume TaxID=102107 RepID=A0ABM1LY34_PRUMU|nr:PREDICTED: uncharacterized protein LOC107881858 [Prunus mume]
MVSPIKLMIGEEEKFQGKALALSHTKSAISTIKEKFSEQQLRTFEESCFGHLLLIEDLKWTSPIVHGLLLRKADPKTVSQVNGIKFIVGNKVIQFTPQQFCVVTGLRKTFHDCADADDALKLGFVYFAVFVLLGSEKHVHIDMRYLKLAEDLEDFGKYPWGAVSYAKTNASLLRALCADYQRVKGPKKASKTKKSKKQVKTTATGRPREYHLKGFAFALQIWAYEVFPALAALHLVVHEHNAYIPRILHWRSNTLPRFYELMSQVFENHQVDVQLIWPSVIDKQQPYWTWGDSVDYTEELVELVGDDAEQKTSPSASIEEKDEDIEETASLPSSSKGKMASTELRTLKRDFERMKDEFAKVASSNRALRNRVHELEEMVQRESSKVERNNKCVEDLRNTVASMEHYFKLELEQLRKQDGGVKEAGEGHEDLGTPHMNEGGDNELSPLHDNVTPPTKSAAMATQVPRDGAEPSAAMVTPVPDLQVHEAAAHVQSEKLPTPEDVAGCDEICQRLMFLLEVWKIADRVPSGGPMNPPSIPTISMAADEEGSLSVEKKEVEGKGCRQKRPAQTLLSPFTDPLRKKRTMSMSDATATPPCFDPSKSLPIEDVKVVIDFCTA